MSYNNLPEFISQFLKSPDPMVVELTGAWGVGKTFGWQRELSKATQRQTEEARWTGYSYVSLFGLNSLQDARLGVFQNTIPLSAVISPMQGSIKSTQKWYARWRGLIKYTDKVPGVKDYLSLVAGIVGDFQSDMLVCFDDLERHGKGLGLEEILGLASSLRDQRNCSVVIIHNTGSLDENDRAVYEKHREKVVDTSFSLRPSAKECADIAFGTGNVADQEVKEHCVKLGIDNIRAIKKIRNYIRMFNEHTNALEPQLVAEIKKSCVVLAWCKLGAGTANVPTIDYVTSELGNKIFMGNVPEDISKEEKAWLSYLEEYGYQFTSEIDLAISESILQGYVSHASFVAATSKENEALKAKASKSEFSDAWRMYHDSLADNESEVVDRIVTAFKACVQSITQANANGTVVMLREIDRSNMADELANFYVEERDETASFFDLSEYAFSADVTDPLLIQLFKCKKGALEELEEFDLRAVLYNIGKHHSHYSHQIERLKEIDTDQFFEIFKSVEGSELANIIEGSLLFRNSSDGSAIISQQAEKALTTIANENPMNARRLSKYRITPEPNPDG